MARSLPMARATMAWKRALWEGLDEVRQLVGDHVVKALGRVGGKPHVDADRAAGGRARAPPAAHGPQLPRARMRPHERLHARDDPGQRAFDLAAPQLVELCGRGVWPSAGAMLATPQGIGGRGGRLAALGPPLRLARDALGDPARRARRETPAPARETCATDARHDAAVPRTRRLRLRTRLRVTQTGRRPDARPRNVRTACSSCRPSDALRLPCRRSR